ncbi:MAG: SDR family NAD(P)-dependent oxidoreductase [Beutenbergiaceae bacterium]
MRDLSDTQSQVVLVTGGDGGIGAGICRQFARRDARVVIHTARQPERAHQLAAAIGAAGVVSGDIRDAEAVRAMVAEVIGSFGRLDVLVNNAGVQPLATLAEMSLEQWQLVVGTNLDGTFLMSQAALEPLAASSGSIINIASIEASTPAPDHAHYDASKAAVKMLTRNCALEWGKLGVRVNSVSPGLVDTGDLKNVWPQGWHSWMSAVPLGRTATTDDIGNACAFLASADAAFITGQDLVVDGGISTVAGW